MKWMSFLSMGLLLQTGNVCASEQEPSLRDIAVNIWHDQSAIVTSPLRMDRYDAMLWGTTGISTLVLMPSFNGHQSLDEHLADGIDRENPSYEGFFKGLTLLGDGRVLFGASLAAYGTGAVTDNAELQRGAARWVEALTDASIWVTAIKMLAGRNRPTPPKSESEFAGPGGYFHDQGVNSSFPSGHTALAFASAAVLTRESDNNPWVGVPLYLTAGAVGFSRVYVEKHWLTDVLVGAVIGQSIGTLVENRRHKKTSSSVRLEPKISRDESGLQLVYTF